MRAKARHSRAFSCPRHALRRQTARTAVWSFVVRQGSAGVSAACVLPPFRSRFAVCRLPFVALPGEMRKKFRFLTFKRLPFFSESHTNIIRYEHDCREQEHASPSRCVHRCAEEPRRFYHRRHCGGGDMLFRAAGCGICGLFRS